MLTPHECNGGCAAFDANMLDGLVTYPLPARGVLHQRSNTQDLEMHIEIVAAKRGSMGVVRGMDSS